MKKILILIGLQISCKCYAQAIIPLPPNVSQYKNIQVTDQNYFSFSGEGKYFILSDSCSEEGWDMCDSSYFGGVLVGYDNALIATREIYALIEYYRKKLYLTNEVNFFKPVILTGEEFFGQMVDKNYFISNNKAFNSRERFYQVIRNPTFTIIGYYELVPNRLKLYFGWNLDGIQYNLIDANKFR